MAEVLFDIPIEFETSEEAATLFGPNDIHLKRIEEYFSIHCVTRGGAISICSNEEQVKDIKEFFYALMKMIRQGARISERDVIYALNLQTKGMLDEWMEYYDEEIIVSAKGKPIRVKTLGQREYIRAIEKQDLVFGIGPAGTGKTYLAVVMAIKFLKQGRIKKIILTRPAVEAGENLGFLPGDLKEKVDPYLRPLYDALHDVLGLEQTNRLMERGIIEVAPLAYMRGRTLDDAFVILDEAQNTTAEQMKMFLTRLGFGSKMVITGDETQVDLPRGKKSGLAVSARILKGTEGISFVYLSQTDVVRHPLVAKIIEAYEKSHD
ncbi:PhoH family protein [Massilibacterium senegalense]|uniref:PhoH family protein n=1 Tax=Massilibacterium senegalense TaxID=1632858 RepID=UPI0007803C73|nr:PhoH family protein [Massilibacterium senegalense]